MRSNDPAYLTKYQYRDSGNLEARILIHQLFSIGRQNWHEFIFEQLQITNGMQVLTLGCGNATQWRANQQRFPISTRIILTDLSFGMVEETHSALENVLPFRQVCQNAQYLAFPGETFDLVTANHMLYHVPDLGQALAEIVRVLKPSGRLMAATNGVGHMQELEDLLHKFDPGYQKEAPMSASFSLENGAQQLREYFGRVEKVLYPSDLWVTDAGLLGDYAFSTPSVQEYFQPQQRAELSAFFQKQIDREGGIFIRKATGIFLAEEPVN